MIKLKDDMSVYYFLGHFYLGMKLPGHMVTVVFNRCAVHELHCLPHDICSAPHLRVSTWWSKPNLCLYNHLYRSLTCHLSSKPSLLPSIPKVHLAFSHFDGFLRSYLLFRAYWKCHLYNQFLSECSSSPSLSFCSPHSALRTLFLL